MEELVHVMSKWEKPLEQQPAIIQRWVKNWIKHQNMDNLTQEHIKQLQPLEQQPAIIQHKVKRWIQLST
jgi:hypothetical protein